MVGGLEVVGVTGTATFNQTCGTNALVGGGSYSDPTHNTIVAGLIVGFYGGYQVTHHNYGDGVGSYNLSGGLLGGPTNPNTGGELIAATGGTGTFTQTGGVNAPNDNLFVGGEWGGAFQTSITITKATGLGIYNLSGGQLTVQSNIQGTGGVYVGESGTGIFTQSGGIVTAPAIYLAGNAVQYARMAATMGPGSIRREHITCKAVCSRRVRSRSTSMLGIPPWPPSTSRAVHCKLLPAV